MTAFILPNDDSGRIISFDVIETDVHETVSVISSHPVEVGTAITDHVRPEPDRMSLVAYVTNQPIIPNTFTQRGEFINFDLPVPEYFPTAEQLLTSPGAALRFGAQAGVNALFGSPEFKAQVLAFTDPFNAIVETYEILRELQINATLLRIVTPIRVYEDMLLERVATPRIAQDSGVAFQIDAVQLRVVESGSVAAPPLPAQPRGLPESAKGSQGTQSGKGGAEMARSVLISLGVGDFLGLPQAQ